MVHSTGGSLGLDDPKESSSPTKCSLIRCFVCIIYPIERWLKLVDIQAQITLWILRELGLTVMFIHSLIHVSFSFIITHSSQTLVSFLPPHLCSSCFPCLKYSPPLPPCLSERFSLTFNKLGLTHQMPIRSESWRKPWEVSGWYHPLGLWWAQCSILFSTTSCFTKTFQLYCKQRNCHILVRRCLSQYTLVIWHVWKEPGLNQSIEQVLGLNRL